MKWWFKTHHQKLQDECNRLEGNSNYVEHSRLRENILISQGEIIVRLEKTSRHSIIIIYPESTPYSLPKVYPLTELVQEGDFNKLGSLSSIEAAQKVSDKVKFYNFWHQNSDGSLCFLEAENLESFGEFFSITEIINRTRDWIVANIRGKSVPEGPEVDLFAHSRKVDNSKEILIPEQIKLANLVQGEFYGVQIAHVYPSEKLQEKRAYLAILLEGETKNGIRLQPIEFNNGFEFMPEGLRSSKEIATKQELVNNCIESKKLIKVYWWSTKSLNNPINNIEELSLLLGEGHKIAGYKRLNKILDNGTLSSENEILLGIQFLNRKKEKQWQTFILKKVKDITPIIGSTDINDYISLFTSFDFEALKCSEFTEDRHHLRNSGVANRGILVDKEITIIGCGALGGEVADTMAKAGVGKINLVDFESMTMDNSIRHVIGIDKMGYAKVHALYQHLFYHNPFVIVKPLPYNVLYHEIEDYLNTNGTGLSTIADDNVEGYINEQAVISNKTIYYARALRGGKAARFFRVIPGKDACFNCLSLYKNESDNRFTSIPEDLTLPTITNECNNPIRPSSASDLKLISSLFTHIVLQDLQNGKSNSNHWVWSAEQIKGVPTEKIKPFTLVESFLNPHPNCQYCHSNSTKYTIEMDSSKLEMMITETKKNPKIETGGVMVGYLDKERDVVKVVNCSGPGPKAIKTETKFLKDKEFCQSFINKEFSKTNQKNSYVGEWHYHPSIDNSPSGTDLKSLYDIAEEKNYLTEDPAMVILNNLGEAFCTIHPYGRSYYNASLIIK